MSAADEAGPPASGAVRADSGGTAGAKAKGAAAGAVGADVRPGPEEELSALERDDLRRRLRGFDASGARGLRLRRGGAGESSPSFTAADGGDGEWVDFASNDYLGLARHPEVAAAVAEGLQRFPAGAAASRLICGGSGAHEALESALAEFKQTEAALLFGSGFAAASGTLPALLGADDFVLLDKLSHACLIDGARLSGATMRVFPHQRLDKLEQLLAWCRARARPGARILIVTESVFSMDGDQAPLAELVALKRQYDALLLLDEAHAIGVIGPGGRGLAAALGLQDQIDFHLGTLSKAVGLVGGYIAARRCWIDLLVNRARSFIFSTAPPPALAWGALASLRLLTGAEGDRRRCRLQQRLEWLGGCLGSVLNDGDAAGAGLRTPPGWPQDRGGGVSPIVPLLTGDAGRALRASEELARAGYLVPAIRYPTVPRRAARLRLSLSSEHEAGQIEGLVAHLGRALAEGGGAAQQLRGQG